MSSTQYRIESAKTGRAGCVDTVCKKEGKKIGVGDLRMGTWTEIADHGSWRWKHWGCVSGFQIQSIRESAAKDDGTYDWDLVDGYDELPDALQAKFRTAIEQGSIDPADFNGDPECNVLGHKGIHLTPAQKRKKEEAAAAENEDAPPKGKKGTKRGRKKADEDDEEEVVKPPKKAKQDNKRPKAKAMQASQESEIEEKVAPTARAQRGSRRAAPAKSLKEQSDSEDEKPAKKGGGKRVKAEDDSEPEFAAEEEDDDSEPEPELESDPESEPEQKKKKTKTTKTKRPAAKAKAATNGGRKARR